MVEKSGTNWYLRDEVQDIILLERPELPFNVVEKIVNRIMWILKTRSDVDIYWALHEAILEKERKDMYDKYLNYLSLFWAKKEQSTPKSMRDYFYIQETSRVSIHNRIEAIEKMWIFDALKEWRWVIVKIEKWNKLWYRVRGITSNWMLRVIEWKQKSWIRKISHKSITEVTIFQ